MRDLRFLALPDALPRGLAALVLLAGLTLAPAAAPAEATMVMPFAEDQPVHVNVGFHTRVPLTDLSEAAVAAAQKAARERLYRVGREECALLKAVLAETCRLSNLNVNTQIQQQYRNNIPRPLLSINGNASFTITLKDEEAGGD